MIDFSSIHFLPLHLMKSHTSDSDFTRTTTRALCCGLDRCRPATSSGRFPSIGVNRPRARGKVMGKWRDRLVALLTGRPGETAQHRTAADQAGSAALKDSTVELYFVKAANF